KSVINYQIFSIYMLDEKQQTLFPRIVIRYNTLEYRKPGLPLGKGLIGTAALMNAPLRVADVTKDPRYVDAHPETRSELVVPLINKGRVIGVIDLESTQLNYFTSDHERILVTLATRVASSLANADLYERVSENERRMDREMRIAREIQHRLMPEELPSIPPLT